VVDAAGAERGCESGDQDVLEVVCEFIVEKGIGIAIERRIHVAQSGVDEHRRRVERFENLFKHQRFGRINRREIQRKLVPYIPCEAACTPSEDSCQKLCY